MPRFEGTYTALVTPFLGDGGLDRERFRLLLDFQAAARVNGVVVGGTTGESPALAEEELARLISEARERLPSRVDVVAGVGRNDRATTERLARKARELGVRAVMLVDPAYNAPSSLEIRREYLVPIAERFPDLEILSYVVPARTGTCLSPIDLELAHRAAPNVVGLKDAAGQTGYSREVRRRLPSPFSLLSGDDGRALAMIADPEIRADGVVSVVSNLAPELVRAGVEAARQGSPLPDGPRAALERLGGVVSFETLEQGPDGPIPSKSRNPLPIKAAFALLGASLGRCRPPLGRLGPAAFEHLSSTLSAVERSDPDALRPVRERLGRPSDATGAPSARAEWRYDAY